MSTAAHTPDLLVIAPRIHVGGGAPPVDALLVRAGRVVAAGTEGACRAVARSGFLRERLDAVVTPGLTDAHIHMTAWALARRRVDLKAAATVEEAVSAVARAGGDGWVRGLGWNANRWGRQPTRQELDAAQPERPAFLLSNDIHAAWLNSAALARCGITRDTPDPDGGEIVRDASGEPTGVLKESAVRLAEAHIPADTPAEKRAALVDAQREMHRVGLTGVHSVEVLGLDDFQDLEAAGQLRLRVLQAIQLGRLDDAIRVGLRSGFGSDWIRLGGVKMFLDGALGSRTAWLREPYEGTADAYGIGTLPEADFRDAVRRAAQAGIASTVHAIGDAAVSLAIDVLSAVAPPASMPHRIEHVQLCPPDLWEAAGRSGIVGSVQPVHLMTDIPAAEAHWGHERSRGAYAFAALDQAGMRLAFGSDAPVETVDPRVGLFAARQRVGWDGAPEDGWFPEHALGVEAAMRGYTEGPAFAAGLEARRGRLAPGFDADLVAWNVDPFATTPEEMRGMQCVLTMVGGEVVHRVTS